MSVQTWKRHVREKAHSCRKRIADLSPGAVLLGISFNTLDAFSLGSLIFPKPSEHTSAFSSLQAQAISLFIMSTIISQLTLTLGGSRLPGVLGSMLIEILPFLRAIALAVESRLGHGHPGILPTTVVAYALTSFLLGAFFLAIGTLRCGSLAGFFPPAVLTGVIGAVGVSMLVSGLEVTLPSSHPPLSVGSVKTSLFNVTHISLLACSVIPAGALCISARSQHLSKWSRGATQHALYIPLFCFAVGAAFWLIAGARFGTSERSLHTLAASGWLFEVQKSRPRSPSTTNWNYWTLFDLSRVEWSALSAGMENYFLLLGIGTLVLAVFLQATASLLGVPGIDLNHEMRLHGFSNIFAAVLGSLSGSLVYANTRFHSQAGGGHDDAFVVAICTIALFFAAPHLLPYFPTIVAAIMVLFLGFQLIIEAVWESSRELMWNEWITVVGTLIACSSLGFAPGVGIGLGIVAILSFCVRISDSRRSIIRPCETYAGPSNSSSSRSVKQISYFLRDFYSSSLPLHDRRLPETGPQEKKKTHIFPAMGSFPHILKLGRSPRFEIAAVGESAKAQVAETSSSHLILDLTQVQDMDTDVTRFVAGCLQDGPRVKVVTQSHDTVQADFARIGSRIETSRRQIGAGSDDLGNRAGSQPPTPALSALEREVYASRFTRHGSKMSQKNCLVNVSTEWHPILTASVLRILPSPGLLTAEGLAQVGLAIRRAAEGQSLACGPYLFECGTCSSRPIFFVLQGVVAVRKSHSSRASPLLRRQSVYRLVLSHLLRYTHALGLAPATTANWTVKISQEVDLLFPGDMYNLEKYPFCCAYAANESCWIIEVDPRNDRAVAWARSMADLDITAQSPRSGWSLESHTGGIDLKRKWSDITE